MKVHYQSNSNEWETPQCLFDILNNEFNFTLDPCATKENAKCKKFYTIKDNGLSFSWKNENVFVNPPYGRKIGDWMAKAYTESMLYDAMVVCLIPARTDTSYWHKFVMGAAEIRFICGRLKFNQSKNSAPFPSAIVVFRRGSKSPIISSFKYSE
jgi:site-specific DNA-methyltransferase (adenine-specific)